MGKNNANDKLKNGWMELSPRPKRIDYEQAWRDLRNKFIDEVTVQDGDTIYASDIKKVMDEMLIDYNY